MPSFKIEKISEDMKIRVTDEDSGEWMQESSVQAILLFSIIEKLEEIRCGLIDVETAVEKTDSKPGPGPY